MEHDNPHPVGFFGAPGTALVFNEGPKNVVFTFDGRAVLTVSKDGVTADPTVPVDDAARAIFEALKPYLQSTK